MEPGEGVGQGDVFAEGDTVQFVVSRCDSRAGSNVDGRVESFQCRGPGDKSFEADDQSGSGFGGKIRDTVLTYNGSVRFPMDGQTPEDYAENMAKMKARKEGFTIIKQAVGFHNMGMMKLPNMFYGEVQSGRRAANRGLMTEHGLNYVLDCVIAMKEVLSDEVGLALDCGPGWTLPDATRFARALEPYNIMWIEDILTGDYTPYVQADLYRDLTMSTSTPVHTGEQIYLRQNFTELIEKQAVNIVGPDPADIGGIAELKWVAEYADLHGILMAPHGTFDGLIGLAALVQVSAAMPHNLIAFEYPIGDPAWWYDIVDGLPEDIVKNGQIEVWDRPGLGVDIIPEAAKQHLPEGDEDFFD